MSTRSTIAEPNGDGFRGRYCHSDGYPTWNAKHLHAIVQRDGVEKARRVLLHENTYWSSIESDAPADAKYHHGDDRFAGVEGYGLAGPGQGVEQDEWITDLEGWDAEWTYILADSELWVYCGTDPVPVRVPYVLHDDVGPADDSFWEDIQAQLYERMEGVA